MHHHLLSWSPFLVFFLLLNHTKQVAGIITIHLSNAQHPFSSRDAPKKFYL